METQEMEIREIESQHRGKFEEQKQTLLEKIQAVGQELGYNWLRFNMEGYPSRIPNSNVFAAHLFLENLAIRSSGLDPNVSPRYDPANRHPYFYWFPIGGFFLLGFPDLVLIRKWADWELFVETPAMGDPEHSIAEQDHTVGVWIYNRSRIGFNLEFPDAWWQHQFLQNGGVIRIFLDPDQRLEPELIPAIRSWLREPPQPGQILIRQLWASDGTLASWMQQRGYLSEMDDLAQLRWLRSRQALFSWPKGESVRCRLKPVRGFLAWAEKQPVWASRPADRLRQTVKRLDEVFGSQHIWDRTEVQGRDLWLALRQSGVVQEFIYPLLEAWAEQQYGGRWHVWMQAMIRRAPFKNAVAMAWHVTQAIYLAASDLFGEGRTLHWSWGQMPRWAAIMEDYIHDAVENPNENRPRQLIERHMQRVQVV